RRVVCYCPSCCGAHLDLHSFPTRRSSDLTRGGSAAYRRRMAVKAILLAAGILYLFAFSGDWLMRALGIGIPAFKIAGGLLLFLRSEEHTSELQSRENLVCRLLLEKNNAAL